MNTNGLAKHYGTLTILERTAAFVAAESRNDEAELRRLAESAPRGGWSIPDFGRPLAVLRDIAGFVLAELLEHVAHFNECYWLAELEYERELNRELEDRPKRRRPPERDGERGNDGERFAELSRVFAYYIAVKFQGWKDFCSSLGIVDSAALWPPQMVVTVTRANELAKHCTFTVDELKAFLAKSEKTDEPITAERYAAELRECFDKLRGSDDE